MTITIGGLFRTAAVIAMYLSQCYFAIGHQQEKWRLASSPSSDHNFCGVGFQDASTSCQHPCPSGSLDECPQGMLCYYNTPCDIKNLGPRPSLKPTLAPKIPTLSPLKSDDPKLTFFCGTDWSDASNKCAVWCPNADDDECPSGQSCFGDTACKKTPDPTLRPTQSQKPTLSPSLRPTGPTTPPTASLMIDQPSNHQFCGYDYLQAIEKCSLETHCPNGQGDCPFPQSCWQGLMDCDVRDFTPFELGGFLNKPTQQQLAEAMGLSYPSDDPTDHFFCGIVLEDINRQCNLYNPCPDGTTSSCELGQACYKNTVCDARIRPDYGVTQSPILRPTPSPLKGDAKEYFSFCGEDWDQANTCKMQWCGNGSECPYGQSCFADTDCNMKTKLDGPPTEKPTDAPITYEDGINFRFCGKTYLDAVAQCSVDSYCKSGKHDECPSGGEFCWSGVSCNIKDMIQPATSRPTVYSPPTSRPSKAPIPLDDPRNYRFCGQTWSDADSCAWSWCPNGSDDECPSGLSCFSDTTCHAAEVTRLPSISPIERHTSVPSMPPIPYDDPINTSFCGFSFNDAKNNCSIDSHCPSGVHQDCPTGQYCWSGTPCNILEFSPSQSPSLNQKDLPSTFSSSTPVITMSPQTKFLLTSSPTSPLINQSLTSHPVSMESETTNNSNSLATTNQWCGETQFDATRNCGRKGYECQTGSCNQEGLQCFITNIKCESASETDNISTSTGLSPTYHSLSPTRHPVPAIKSVFFPPISKEPIPKSPNENIVQVQNIIERVQARLRSEIFVLPTRGGALIKSSLYTYEGFLSALLFYSNSGVNNNFFYLGGMQSSGSDQFNLELEFGLANLGLFVAKTMTDTISYDRCTPDLLACGLPAFDTVFEAQQVRFMCPSSSEITGLECDEGGGCACTLGFLNQNIGMNSTSSSKYAGLNFCNSNRQSICNRIINEGAELRWITAMTYWVLSVQRNEENTWLFLDELRKFVKDGMVDNAFLYAVADLSVFDTSDIGRESSPTKQQFIDNFFKVISTLSEGQSQAQTAAPNPISHQTASPSAVTSPATIPNPATTKPTTPSSPPQIPRPTHFTSITPSTSHYSSKSRAPADLSQASDQVENFETQINDTTTLSTRAPVVASDTETGAQPICPNFCTVVTPIEECPSQEGSTVPMTILYCSHVTGMNEFCLGNGYCGTSELLDNCGIGRSVYRRTNCSTLSEDNEVSHVTEGATSSPTTSGSPCSLCWPEEIGTDAQIIFNGNQSTCAKVSSFLQQMFYAGDVTCVSAKSTLSAACCKAASNEPFPSPIETIQPTLRSSDLPWYTKYTESRPNSPGGHLSHHFYSAALVFILAFIV